MPGRLRILAPIISRMVTAKTINKRPEMAEIIISLPALIPLGLPAEVTILTAPKPARMNATTAAIDIETVKIVVTVLPPLSPVSNSSTPPIEQVGLQGMEESPPVPPLSPPLVSPVPIPLLASLAKATRAVWQDVSEL